jgi:hypothetical protein
MLYREFKKYWYAYCKYTSAIIFIHESAGFLGWLNLLEVWIWLMVSPYTKCNLFYLFTFLHIQKIYPVQLSCTFYSSRSGIFRPQTRRFSETIVLYTQLVAEKSGVHWIYSVKTIPDSFVLGCPRNKQNKFSVRTETNRNSTCFGSFSVCFAKPINYFFGLFRFVRCFGSILKQPKQTDRFRNKPKKEKMTEKMLILLC